MKVAMDAMNEDYLYAKLHAVWSRSFHGERLEQLRKTGSAEALRQALKGLGFDFTDSADLERQLTGVMYQQIGQIVPSLSTELVDFYYHQLLRSYLNNVKMVLREWAIGDERERVDALLMRVPGYPQIERDAHGQFRLATAELPRAWQQVIAAVAEEARTSRDTFVAESRLDCFFWQQYLACARRTEEAVPEVLAVVGDEADIRNVMALLRNLRLYRLPAAQIRAVLVAGGRRLGGATLDLLSSQASDEALLSKLPAPYAELVRAALPLGLVRVEKELWDWWWLRLRRQFGDAGTPALAVAVYPFLKSIEVQNLVRLCEAWRYGLSAEETAVSLVGR